MASAVMPPRRDLAPEPWQPSFPGQATDDRTLYAPKDPGAENAPQAGQPWEAVPPTSHLHGFKSLTDSFTRNFVAESYGFARGHCVFMIAFKPKGKQPYMEYAYAFPTPEACEGWADVFRGATHPGEHIPDVQAACVKYKRVR